MFEKFLPVEIVNYILDFLDLGIYLKWKKKSYIFQIDSEHNRFERVKKLFDTVSRNTIINNENEIITEICYEIPTKYSRIPSIIENIKKLTKYLSITIIEKRDTLKINYSIALVIDKETSSVLYTS